MILVFIYRICKILFTIASFLTRFDKIVQAVDEQVSLTQIYRSSRKNKRGWRLAYLKKKSPQKVKPKQKTV